MAERPAVVSSRESASADLAESDQEASPPQRLVVCLDGSWNKRGSGTNIYHIANLICEGTVTEAGGKEWLQRAYYDEGVGTGVLDRISGGAFGVGVSENVRQAYDWLVEKYNTGDEVYIFGFSRGAFTARSLVGLIAKCGLVFRGAPIPQEQLWEGYRALGRHPDWRSGDQAEVWKQRILEGQVPFRPLKLFKKDWWREPDEARAEPLNQTEKLLMKWSRRIPIKCLGVFDTVGTFGVEAVAIPWLQARRAQFHDTELTSSVENAFHALAIDEHRANFSHIPWRRPIEPTGTAEAQGQEGQIEQRWFIGAHSNIGGGYADDVLAQFPLRWMIENCERLGLRFSSRRPDFETGVEKCVPLHPGPLVKNRARIHGNIGDSFSEFFLGVWRYTLRNKRNYRRIKPPPEFQNGRAVQSVNERVHESVADLIRADQGCTYGSPPYLPVNLWEYWRRCGTDAERKLLGDKEPPLTYWSDRRTIISTLVWLFGLAWASVWIVGQVAPAAPPLVIYSLMLVIPAVGWLADYLESRSNRRFALAPDTANGERQRSVILDKTLNIRLFLLGVSCTGLVVFFVDAVRWLSTPVPAAEVLWLLGLFLLAVRLNASWNWSNAPIAQLGGHRGSWLFHGGYGNRFALPRTSPPPGGSTPAIAKARQQWMRRGLLRDAVGFLPASVLAIGFGWWLTLDFFWRRPGDRVWGGLNLEPRVWWPVVALAVIYAVCAFVENRRVVSRLGSPPLRAARLSPSAIFYSIGIAGFVAAILILTGLQFGRVLIRFFYLLANWFTSVVPMPDTNYVFVDERMSGIDISLFAWAGLIAAGVAIYQLMGALRQGTAAQSRSGPNTGEKDLDSARRQATAG